MNVGVVLDVVIRFLQVSRSSHVPYDRASIVGLSGGAVHAASDRQHSTGNAGDLGDLFSGQARIEHDRVWGR